MTPANASKPELFDKWLFSSMEKMTANPYSLDNHIRPQADFFVPNAEIFKLEDGYENEWVSTISDRIGLKFKKPKMGHAMVSKKHSKESYAMSERAKNKIRSVYAMDFTTFNYSM
jgi:hypothetical protein